MNTKIIIASTIGLFALVGTAQAENAPFLYGNYSANVLESYGAGASVATPSSDRLIRTFNYSSEKAVSPARNFNENGFQAGRPLGNYAPNIRLQDVRGH